MADHKYQAAPAPNGYLAAQCRGCHWYAREVCYLNSDIAEVLGMLMGAYQQHIVLLGNMP